MTESGDSVIGILSRILLSSPGVFLQYLRFSFPRQKPTSPIFSSIPLKWTAWKPATAFATSSSCKYCNQIYKHCSDQLDAIFRDGIWASGVSGELHIIFFGPDVTSEHQMHVVVSVSWLPIYKGALRKTRQQRERERHQTKGLMSITIAVNVPYNSWYISLPFSAKQLQNSNVKSPNSMLSREREPQRLIFRISIWNWTHSWHIQKKQVLTPTETLELWRFYPVLIRVFTTT